MYTIGEFSKLCHVSARMLRFFDANNVLRPAHTDEATGYRYYDASQLSVVSAIEKLKSYGFTLSEIKTLLKLPDKELAERMHQRRLKLFDDLGAMQEALRTMQSEISNLEGTRTVSNTYHVVLINDPPQHVLGLRKRIHTGEVRALFNQLLANVSQCGLTRTGSTQMLYHGEEFSYENMDVEAQVEVSGKHCEVVDRPAQLCVATEHAGAYDTLRHAYDALCGYLALHQEYEVCGPAIERYLVDEDSAKSPDELRTSVLFPVKRK